jgi:hypothetical protein
MVPIYLILDRDEPIQDVRRSLFSPTADFFVDSQIGDEHSATPVSGVALRRKRRAYTSFWK